MLPLEVIKQYYPKASEEELKDIQEVVYLLACAVMQHFYGSKWMGGFEEPEQEGKKTLRLVRFPLGYKIMGLNFSKI